jgi:hypothetical protein
MVSAGSVSAMLYGQSPETRAERIVELADKAEQRVGNFIELVYESDAASDVIENADFVGNVTLYDEGSENVTNAHACLASEDYEGATANATEALSIFREVYRSIHVILFNSDVKIGPLVDVDVLEEAIDRSLERVGELKALIATQAGIYDKLIEAEDLLTTAKDELLPDNIEGAKTNLREANILISEVCQYLRQVARELNPSRIRGYLDEAYRYRYRFRERFRQAQDEGFDVNGFLQGFGYQNEEEFMNRFQEMIENAQGSEDVEDVLEDLEEIGRLIREMNGNLTQEMGRYREHYGQEATGSGFGGFGQESSDGGQGQYGSYGVNTGSGQMGFGSSR